jgi:hypothetical protein
MMRRWTALSAALAAGVLGSVLVATPASASTTAQRSCSVSVDAGTFRLTVSADYVDNATTRIRTWTGFRFLLRGGPTDNDHNNVNIRVYEYGVEKWAYNSPDYLEYDRSYRLSTATPVRTRMTAPVLLTFEGIFDVSLGADPSCTALVYA